MTRCLFQRRINRLTFCAVTMLLISVRTAAAQSDPESYRLPPGPAYPPVPPYPVELGFSQHHSSTLQEGWQRGRAALIQAWGNYQLSTSQAQIHWEHARALDRENDLRQTAALHAQHEMWRANRQQLREARDARCAEGLKKLAVRRSTVYREAYQLTASQFDPGTGEINWPVVLQDARFQPTRERVDELFRTHVGYGEPQAATAAEIKRCIEPLVRALRESVGTVPRDEYVAAQKFLRGLKCEAMSLADAA